MHPAKAVEWSEVSFGRDTPVIPSDIVLERGPSGKEGFGDWNCQFAAMPPVTRLLWRLLLLSLPPLSERRRYCDAWCPSVCVSVEPPSAAKVTRCIQYTLVVVVVVVVVSAYRYIASTTLAIIAVFLDYLRQFLIDLHQTYRHSSVPKNTSPCIFGAF